VLAIHVQPGAKRSEVVGLYGEQLKIKIAAPAIDGRANAALIEFIAERLDIARTSVKIVRGEGSRAKLVTIAGTNAQPHRLLSA
jgi:uncharacterized protein (TIGR00251 family)